MAELYDVIEVPMNEPRRVRIIAEQKTERNADAIVSMAVARRGVEDSFFTTCLAGQFREGDLYAA